MKLLFSNFFVNFFPSLELSYILYVMFQCSWTCFVQAWRGHFHVWTEFAQSSDNDLIQNTYIISCWSQLRDLNCWVGVTWRTLCMRGTGKETGAFNCLKWWLQWCRLAEVL